MDNTFTGLMRTMPPTEAISTDGIGTRITNTMTMMPECIQGEPGVITATQDFVQTLRDESEK